MRRIQKYTTIVYFEDLTDNNYPYHVGDTYPRKGLNPSGKRIEELSTDKNIRGIPLIAEVHEKSINDKQG